MLARVIAFACFAVVSFAAMAVAQADGPAEQPPAEYEGQSYVDSNGCIFLKAGYGGDATWVPRVGQDRKPICGQTPTKAVSNVTEAAGSDVAPAPTAKVRKRVVGAGKPRAAVKIGCPISVPVARRYATTDGGSVVICTATNGSLTGARSPIYPAGSGVGAALSSTRYPGVTIPLVQPRGAALASAGVTPPKGYERAWKDDRLNPLRGKGTAEGQAAQDKVWTRDVPARAVVAKASGKPVVKTTVAASNGGFFVQVGAFGEPSNADGASARLTGLGLPVSKGKFTSGGRVLQVVYAGPFASGAEAQAALRAARGNGFSDAFIR
jgi:cell division septation protein DedD